MGIDESGAKYFFIVTVHGAIALAPALTFKVQL